MARMDHLENRRWIEESRRRALWLAKGIVLQVAFSLFFSALLKERGIVFFQRLK